MQCFIIWDRTYGFTVQLYFYTNINLCVTDQTQEEAEDPCVKEFNYRIQVDKVNKHNPKLQIQKNTEGQKVKTQYGMINIFPPPHVNNLEHRFASRVQIRCGDDSHMLCPHIHFCVESDL